MSTTPIQIRQLSPLAEALIAKRGERSIRAVAAELGEPFTNIAAIERGRMPSPLLFLKLLRYLGVITKATAEKLAVYAQ